MKIATKQWFEHIADLLGDDFVGVQVYKGRTNMGRIPRADEKINHYYVGILAVVQPSEELKEQLGYDVALFENQRLGIYELRYPPRKVCVKLANIMPTAQAKRLSHPEGMIFTEDFFCLRREPQHPVFIFEPE